MGDYLLTDADFISRLSTENRSLFQRLFDEIKYLCRIATAGSKEARQLEKVKHTFEQAYRANSQALVNSQNAKNTAEDGGVRYSLCQFEDGRRFVELDQEQDRFDGHDRSEYPSIAKSLINEKFNGKVIGQDNRAFVNGSGRDEYIHPSKPIKDEAVYDAKMRAAGELDNLLDAGIKAEPRPDGLDGHVHENVNQWEYLDTVFKIGKRYFSGRVNIARTNKGLLFKDVTKIEDVTQAIMDSYGETPKFQFLRTSPMNSISAPESNVNKRFASQTDTQQFNAIVSVYQKNKRNRCG